MKHRILFLILLLSVIHVQAQQSQRADNGKYGFKAEDGSWLVPPCFDTALSFVDTLDITPVKYRGKYGYINKQGQFVIKPTYLLAQPFCNRSAVVHSAIDSCFMINYQNDVITPTFSTIRRLNNVSLCGFYGQQYLRLCDYTCKPLTEMHFTDVKYDTFGRYTLLQAKGSLPNSYPLRWGLVTERGHTILPMQYQAIEHLTYLDKVVLPGKLQTKLNDKYDLTNKQQLFVYVRDTKNHWGIVTLTGKKLVPFWYQYQSDIKNSLWFYYWVTMHKLIKKDWGAYLASLQIAADDHNIACERNWSEDIYPLQTNKPINNLTFTKTKKNTIIQYGQLKAKLTVKSFTDLGGFYLVKNMHNKYGVIDFYGLEVLPIEYDSFTKFGDDKSTVYKITKKNRMGLANQYGQLVLNCLYTLSLIPQTDVYIMRNDSTHQYGLLRTNGDKLMADNYDTIYCHKTAYDTLAYVISDHKYGLYNLAKHTNIANAQFLSIEPWNEKNHIYLATASKEITLYNTSGYSVSSGMNSIFPIQNGFAIFTASERFGLINEEGKRVTKKLYDNIFINDKGKYVCEIDGFYSNLTADGQEENSLAKQSFEAARALSNPHEQITAYTRCSKIDNDNSEKYKEICFYNIGVCYENLNDRSSAMDYYMKSYNLGYESGRLAYNRLRSQQQAELAAAIMGAVAAAASAAATIAGAVTSSSSSSSSSSYTSSSSSSYSGGSNEGNYRSMYAMWERRAESNYNSLTNLGYRATSKTGDHSGSTMQSMSGSNYTEQNRLLREAQNNMARIRREASRAGISIPQSKWETATVSY